MSANRSSSDCYRRDEKFVLFHYERERERVRETLVIVVVTAQIFW